MYFSLENSESGGGASPRAVIQPSSTPWILWAEGKKQIQNLRSAAQHLQMSLLESSVEWGGERQ